ncbi:META domain-containing protein [Pacificitalea manganoxidans]|uniref:META domain-containing protein n=1 Tax=Pacificitalea manganoxidans TaxID=1411902 RepID=UPI0012FDFF7E|nr:META domain-containing protein [Pacificitalea manganoxidans]MDR6309825.1 heat shock protein HslJ [Pacificitalea manganoxidans]
MRRVFGVGRCRLAAAAIMVLAGSAISVQAEKTLSEFAGNQSEWVLVAIDGAPAPDGVTLTFPVPNRISGQGPCNSYSAQIVAPFPWFSLAGITATRMVCPALEAEQRYFSILEHMSAVELNGASMTLTGAGESLRYRAR